LQPPQQSPQRVQAGCATPAGLTRRLEAHDHRRCTGAWPSATTARIERSVLGAPPPPDRAAGRTHRAARA
jgi:hypothetical protein